jgi:hypothetical protein
MRAVISHPLVQKSRQAKLCSRLNENLFARLFARSLNTVVRKRRYLPEGGVNPSPLLHKPAL